MIGIGADLVQVDRFRSALDRTPRLRERLFRPDERMYAEQAIDPAQRYAVRFAAKEATLKALGLGLGAMALYDIEVIRELSGRPTLCLHNKALVKAAMLGVTQWHLTLTHTGQVAHATVVAL